MSDFARLDGAALDAHVTGNYGEDQEVRAMASSKIGVNIKPDATITIQQKCSACDGSGTTGVRSYCAGCGHLFTQEELQEMARTMAERMPCGCDWRLLHEEDTYCAECEGDGTQHLTVTMQELAFALWRMQPSLAE